MTSLQIPDFHSLVRGSGNNELPISCELQTGNGLRVSRKTVYQLLGSDFPDLRATIGNCHERSEMPYPYLVIFTARCKKLPIRAEAKALNEQVVAVRDTVNGKRAISRSNEMYESH